MLDDVKQMHLPLGRSDGKSVPDGVVSRDGEIRHYKYIVILRDHGAVRSAAGQGSLAGVGGVGVAALQSSKQCRWS